MNKPNIILLVLDQLRVDRFPFFKEFIELESKGIFFSTDDYLCFLYSCL